MAVGLKMGKQEIRGISLGGKSDGKDTGFYFYQLPGYLATFICTMPTDTQKNTK